MNFSDRNRDWLVEHGFEELELCGGPEDGARVYFKRTKAPVVVTRSFEFEGAAGRKIRRESVYVLSHGRYVFDDATHYVRPR